MMDFINKLGDVKKKMDEIKKRLNAITVEGIAGNGLVKVVCTGNKKVQSVAIADQLMATDKKDELQELLEVAINRAIEQAEQVSETEMKAAGRDFLPGMPGF